MDEKKLKTAIAEARRFLLKAMELEKNTDMFSNKHSSAVKRSSMDLTRALADLRRSGNK